MKSNYLVRKHMHDFKIVRLSTKEVIICKTNSKNASASSIILEDPFEIKSFMNPQTGDFNSTLIDWLQYSDDTIVEVAAYNVIAMNTPSPEIIDHYEMILRRKAAAANSELNETEGPGLEDVDEDHEHTIEELMRMINGNKVYH